MSGPRCGVSLRVAAVCGLAALWCLACQAASLTWESHPGYRSAAVAPPPKGRTGFTLLSPADTGVRFTNELSDFAAAQNRVLEIGSGVALGDVDGDGLCDIYLCRLEGDNALYRNLGDWKFEDITAQAGVACPNQFSTGAVLADVDGDGDLDLLVNCVGGGTRCYFNDGKGHFTEVTDGRLAHRYTATSMALADMDGDGDLDLFVANYSTTSYRDKPAGLKVEARRENGKIVITPPDRFIPIAPRGGAVEVIEMGERDYLYLNDGRGRFLPVSWTNGAFLDGQG
ncbi:MAG: VCBS repeat-containing protein, partial [Verrucomicrobia bacterium]|nr:VCBS repeat-containing protein [Verrucomicrobiota bacterium]